ncbi:TatD family hydrolase [Psychrobacter sp. I-STPA6b]|uniref:TatD family hydrolase n=1 Tax=Psychrobacter sp. I-STPA6b TaxID=2585718 RepID=UPI001D0C8CA9|nr:TatD family hydrolase [Psychrobacter sp. I-STPA6b]
MVTVATLAPSLSPTFIDSSSEIPIIDTHTHFDMPVFANDRVTLATQAWQSGVRHLVLVGYVQRHFMRMQQTKAELFAAATDNLNLPIPQVYVAAGLHPAYIHEHQQTDLPLLAEFVKTHQPIAIGEIGMDTYEDTLKTDSALAKQRQFFIAQLDLAVSEKLPVILHIRKAHAQCLKILKEHQYDAQQLGGIAHSFSGGEQEAKAFVELGFKLGVTGQITNPNAKKLRRAITCAVEKYGLDCLVLETDCPDMLPYSCYQPSLDTQQPNVPANLAYVFAQLSEMFSVDRQTLAHQLWKNSCEAFKIQWQYPPLIS